MRAHGIDYSKWVHDWILPEGAPADFAIQRFGYGLTIDERLENHSKRLGQVDIRGAYWYYKTNVHWTKQVDKFLKIANNHPHKIHMLWWDVEKGFNDFTKKKKVANETLESMKRLSNNFDGIVGLYCNVSTYIDYLQPFIGKWLEDKPLWLANYDPDFEMDWARGDAQPAWYVRRGIPARKRFIDRPKNSWAIWQYNENGDPEVFGVKGKKAVDVNVFNGTIEDLRKFVGLEAKPEKPDDEKVIDLSGVSVDLEGVDLVEDKELIIKAIKDSEEKILQAIQEGFSKLSIQLSGTNSEPSTIEKPSKPTEGPDWLGWEKLPSKEKWPTEVDGKKVGYVYVKKKESHLVYMDKDKVYTIYENPDWGSKSNVKRRRVIAKSGRYVMVYKKGDTWHSENKEVRPFEGDGGTLAYRVMNQQSIDGKNLWEFSHDDLFVFYKDTDPKKIFVPSG